VRARVRCVHETSHSLRAFLSDLAHNEIMVGINRCALHLQWLTELGASLIGNPPAMKECDTCSTTCHLLWMVDLHLQDLCPLQMWHLLPLLPLQRQCASLHLYEFETLCTVYTFRLALFHAAHKYLWILPRQTSASVEPPWCLWLILGDAPRGGH